MALYPTKQNALQKAQACFRAANLHPSSSAFRLKCIDDQNFYDGTGQWAHWLKSGLSTLGEFASCVQTLLPSIFSWWMRESNTLNSGRIAR
jgi:hypothetical protein